MRPGESPGDDDRRLPEGERRIGERLAGRAQSRTTRPVPPTGTHEARRAALQTILDDARRRGCKESERLALAWIDDEYVSRAHLRAEDREIKRLRRWLREAA